MATEKKPRMTIEEKIAALEAKAALLKKSLKEKERQAKARAITTDRKLRSRQLIILGAALVKSCETGESDSLKAFGKLSAHMSERDKELIRPLLESLQKPKEPKESKPVK